MPVQVLRLSDDRYVNCGDPQANSVTDFSFGPMFNGARRTAETIEFNA